MFSSFFRTETFFIFLIVLLVAASLSPVLFFGRVFFNEEQIGFYYPQSFFYADSLKKETSLLWNNGYYGGISVPFDQFVSAYFPVNRFLFSAFDFVTAHHLSIFIGVLFGCLCAYFFGRKAGFEKSSSFILSSTYLLSTTFSWLGTGTLAAWSFFMIPALFFALAKVSSKETPVLWTILGGVFIAIGFLAGFAQITIYGYVLAGIFALYLALAPLEVSPGEMSGLPIRRRIGPLMGFGIMSTIGALLSLPQTLPSVILVGDTIRSTTYAIQKASATGVLGLISFLVPEYMRMHLFSRVAIGGGHGGFYPGALSFLAALLGILLRKNKPPHQTITAPRASSILCSFWCGGKTQSFFILLYIGIILMAFHIPPFSWFNDYLPPFSRFSSSFRWAIAAAFPLGVLAAAGYQNLLMAGAVSEREKRILRFIFWGIIGMVFVVVVANVLLFALERMPELQSNLLDWYLKGRDSVFPREHYESVLNTKITEARSVFSIFDWRVALPLIFLAASFFLIKRSWEGRLRTARFEFLSILLMGANVLLVPAAVWSRDFFPSSVLAEKPALVRAIEEREGDFESFRIAGFAIGQSIFENVTSKRRLTAEEHARIMVEFLVNNTNVMYGLDRLDGAEFYRTHRHNHVLDTVIFPRGRTILDRKALLKVSGPLYREYNTEVLRTVTFAEKTSDFLTRLPLLSAYNVKYIYSLVPLASRDLKEIPLDFKGPADTKPHLYENLGVLPRVYFAKNIEFFAGEENELLGLMADNKDFGRNTFIECVDCEEQASGTKRKFDVLRYENGLLEIEVDAGKGGPLPAEAASAREGRWLVFNESFSPGWEALLDGTATSIYRANYIMQGIYVPPGSHSVQFRHIGVISQKWKELNQRFKD